MSEDRELADLLGQSPQSCDPGFRFDVLSLTAERARRHASRQRALRTVSISTLIGLTFPVAQQFGLGSADLRPLLLVAGVLALAYVLALLTIEGPRGALARSRAALRAQLF